MNISSLSDLFEQSGLQIECELTRTEDLCDRYTLSVLPMGTSLRYSYSAKLPIALALFDAQERVLMDVFLSQPRSQDIAAIIDNHMHVITQDFAVIFAEGYQRLGVNLRARRAIAAAINAQMHSMDYCVEPETKLPARDLALQEVAHHLHHLGFTQAVRGIVAADAELSAGRTPAEAAAAIALAVMAQESDGPALVDQQGVPCTLNIVTWTRGLARLRHVASIVHVLRFWKQVDEISEPYFSRYLEGFLSLVNIDTRHGNTACAIYKAMPAKFKGGEVLAVRTRIYDDDKPQLSADNQLAANSC